MIDEPDSGDQAKILPPNYALKKKIGNVNLDQILSPKAVEAAQEIIVQAAEKFQDEAFSEMENLEKLTRQFAASPPDIRQVVYKIIDSAFALKSQKGLGGYDLVATLAKSLQLLCEQMEPLEASAKNMTIVNWHVDSMKRLLALKVKGSGGQIGEEILAELDKINKQQPEQAAPDNT